MSFNVKLLFKGTIPGVGFSSAGVPKQNKTMVIARIETLDVQSGTETLSPQAFGLETIDFINLKVVSASGGVPTVSATTSVTAECDDTTNKIFISDVAAAGDRAAITNNEDPVVQVFAVGDSAFVADLT